MEALDGSPEYLKTGTTDKDFQQAANQDAAMYLLYSFERTGVSIGAHSLLTITGIYLFNILLQSQQ